MLDVPKDLIWFVSRLLAARRRQIGTRKGTRRLGCYKQAVFALAWFRDKGDIPRLGRGFGLPQSTAYRYLDEVIEVLADRARACETSWSARWPRARRTLSWTARSWTPTGAGRKPRAARARRPACGTRARPAISA